MLDILVGQLVQLNRVAADEFFIEKADLLLDRHTGAGFLQVIDLEDRRISFRDRPVSARKIVVEIIRDRASYRHAAMAEQLGGICAAIQVQRIRLRCHDRIATVHLRKKVVVAACAAGVVFVEADVSAAGSRTAVVLELRVK